MNVQVDGIIIAEQSRKHAIVTLPKLSCRFDGVALTEIRVHHSPCARNLLQGAKEITSP